MTSNNLSTRARRLAAGVALAVLGAFALPALPALAASTIVILNANGAGEGFNDPTPATPVGGNTGTTLGAQRLIAFQHAADLWAANLDSPVTIRVSATFEPLACTENSAVLGSAGTRQIFADFPNTPKPTAWYPGALASKLAGTDLATAGEAHILARFNARLGLFPDCLPGTAFYLGLDNAHGDQVDLVSVLLHELAHGLGFQSFTNSATGQRIDGRPAIWDYFMIDNRNNKLWVDMSDEERRQSATSGDALVWNGPNVTSATPVVLAPQPTVQISGESAGSAAGNYNAGEATFGAPLSSPPVTGDLMPVVDQTDGSGLACEPLNAANALAVKGNIALVDRGVCGFTVKAKNVQDAGARGIVVADNVPGEVTGMGGSDAAVTIPAARITQATGQALKLALQRRSRTASGVIAALGVDPDRRAGTDAAKRIRLYTPPELASGSSVSHYTVEAKPNQLMEPFVSPDLPHEVKPPRDLTLPLLKDIGW